MTLISYLYLIRSIICKLLKFVCNISYLYLIFTCSIYHWLQMQKNKVSFVFALHEPLIICFLFICLHGQNRFAGYSSITVEDSSIINAGWMVQLRHEIMLAVKSSVSICQELCVNISYSSIKVSNFIPWILLQLAQDWN